MAGSPPDPLCCHFALAKDLAEKKMDPGVRARDKLLLDVVELVVVMWGVGGEWLCHADCGGAVHGGVCGHGR